MEREATAKLQAALRGALVRRDARLCRERFVELLREVEGERAAATVSWGRFLSRPKFGITHVDDVQDAVCALQRAQEPGDLVGASRRDGCASSAHEFARAVHEDLSAPRYVVEQLESELSWLKQALHARRLARREQRSS